MTEREKTDQALRSARRALAHAKRFMALAWTKNSDYLFSARKYLDQAAETLKDAEEDRRRAGSGG